MPGGYPWGGPGKTAPLEKDQFPGVGGQHEQLTVATHSILGHGWPGLVSGNLGKSPLFYHND